MRFEDRYFSRELQFSLGIERTAGTYYLSIPVSAGIVDYEKFFEIDQSTFGRFMHEPTSAAEFVERCRRHATTKAGRTLQP
ncbi:hypothetical protein [Nocardia yamanashiensis]|uniref:hypothetical protein n=1 Tax=Nocardia yamanashiensis TaxID=209247 RepID=UPI000835F851|nr:hypothetical protein [Nocardia yamanashiensis]